MSAPITTSGARAITSDNALERHVGVRVSRKLSRRPWGPPVQPWLSEVSPPAAFKPPVPGTSAPAAGKGAAQPSLRQFLLVPAFDNSFQEISHVLDHLGRRLVASIAPTHREGFDTPSARAEYYAREVDIRAARNRNDIEHLDQVGDEGSGRVDHNLEAFRVGYTPVGILVGPIDLHSASMVVTCSYRNA